MGRELAVDELVFCVAAACDPGRCWTALPDFYRIWDHRIVARTTAETRGSVSMSLRARSR